MPLRIAISGSTGLVGSALVEAFSRQGHRVTLIIRPRTPLMINKKVVRWNVEREYIDTQGLENHDVVIHLAGANLASQRWTTGYKKIVEDSRVKSTAFLSQTLAQLKHPPRLFLTASAVGFYGPDSSNEEVDEESPMGTGFLAQVCDRWEKATQLAKACGIRVVHLRTGMVLSQKGGALKMMLPVFKMGLGGKLGSGVQPMSWISLDEIPEIISHIFKTDAISGPVNLTTSQVVTNEEFTKILGKVLRRPTFVSAPAFMIRLMFGEMADSLLLSGAKVAPRKLLESGYQFIYPDLEQALNKILK
ncbi:MAG: TIGR01777 family oxidoreductase [Candidatus Omnitrophota bacterium]